MISPDNQLSINKQLEVTGISKGDYYYEPAPEKEDEADIRKEIDKEYTEHPFKGVRQMRAHLAMLGFLIGVKRVRRIMREMAINPFYPKENTSKRGQAKYVHKYLLRHLDINHRNQVWSTDITYIHLGGGKKAYLYAIIDVYSRYIVGWGLYVTLESANAIEVLRRAVERYGAPEIINSDQGSQYTCHEWVDALKELGIQISMDGRGRCRDNAWIERFWRTVKWEYVYLNPHENAGDMREGLRGYIGYYNDRRPHGSLANRTPRESYLGSTAGAA